MLVTPPVSISQCNPFTSGAPARTHRSGGRKGRRSRLDPSLLREYGSRAEQCRFLRESGLELSDFGLAEWAEIEGDDYDVRLHMAIHEAGNQEHDIARKTRAVSSSFLSSDQFRLGYNAIAIANVYGFVMNVMISISWSTVGITAKNAVSRAHQRYLELLRKALKRRRLPVGWVWVIENGPKWGLHSHILLTVPHEKKDWLKFQVGEAIATIAGRPPVHRAGTRTFHIHHRRDDDWRAQWKLFQYIMKGMKSEIQPLNPERHRRLLQESAALRLSSQGPVSGKRFGTSRGIGNASISQRFGGTPFEDLELEGRLTPADLFSDVWYDSWREKQRALLREKTKQELLATLHI